MSDARFEDRSEAEIAEMVVDLRTRQGFAADRRTSDGHEFVLAKREDPAESELTWVAGRRTVSDERLERFRNSARQLGADSARVVTVGEGRLAGEAPESVAHTTGAELADRLAAEGLIESAEGTDADETDTVDTDTADTDTVDPEARGGESSNRPDERETPDSPDPRAAGETTTLSTQAMGAPDAGSTPASELWDGRTVWSPGPARTDLWQGATTGGSPPTDRALELWNGTTRIADTEP